MSSLKVEIVKIDQISNHPNADKLEIAHVKGWSCIIPKSQFVTGQLAVYIPIDSILPDTLEAILFGPNSKIKLHHHRIKTIKIRGAISQGLLVDPNELSDYISTEDIYEGNDLIESLGVTKYEPPTSISPQSNIRQKRKNQINPFFNKYCDIENWKYYPKLFAEGESVWILEKLHGTNFRCGWVPVYDNNWWHRLLRCLGIRKNWEFVYGSHNVQLQEQWLSKNFYQKNIGKNVYWEAVEKYDLKNKIGLGEIIYGEIYGDGIQKHYLYDCKLGERKLRIFDVKLSDIYGNQVYIDHIEVINYCGRKMLPVVPVDYSGVYTEEELKRCVNIESSLYNGLREGCVIKPYQEELTYMGRKILKLKNPSFELEEEDDTH